jgi:apolipoprotein N-acyltransferase
MKSEAGGRGCAVAAVDAQVSASDRSRDGILQRYLMGTAEAVKQGATRVVWPESALPGYPETDAALQRQLRELVSDAGATTLIAGGPRVEWTAGWEQRLFNSVYQVETTGPLRSYDKRRLVPFAEYWPGGLPARPAWLATDEVAPGTRAGVFTAGGCRYGVVICFEAEDPALARELARAGADVLLVLSNDAQVPPPAVWKEIGQVQLRAVETGVPVVRAANSGISVAVDRYGVVRRQQEGGVLLAPALRAQPTAAVRFAPGFNLVCWLAAAAVLAGGVVRR